MINKIFNHNRIDCILIWGHGLKYLSEILQDITQNTNFKILKIVKHKPKNMKAFVREIYSHDYAPFWHLKAKTKYLLTTSNEVCFVFIKNLNPKVDYFGENSFRHLESTTLKFFKETLRSKFNHYDNGILSKNHVVHATDSQEQAEHMLNLLGYVEGINLFNCENKFIDLPYYIKGYKNFQFREVCVRKIYCNVIEGVSWNNFSYKTIHVTESPQYLGLSENMSLYKNYIDKFLGGALQEYYNLERYKKVFNDFVYLKYPFQNSFVIVEKFKDKFIILDGLHRACVHFFQGNKSLKVCQISK